MEGSLDKKFWGITIFSVLSVVILSALLLPGYVLSLDMVFAPHMKLVITEGNYQNMLPLNALMSLVTYIIDGQWMEKIILLLLFFCLGYLPFRYLPLPDKFNIKVFAGLFYCLNPFVYERFLAGHWTILFAYAFLPVFLHLIIKFNNEVSYKNAIKLAAILLLINIFSLHIFVMAILITAVDFIYILIKKFSQKEGKETAKKLLIFILVFLIINLYWLAPALISPNKQTSAFNKEHFTAFQTAGDPRFGTALNVLFMHGFWGENYEWSYQFIFAKANIVYWLTIMFVLLTLIIFGIWHSLKIKETRALSISILVMGFFAFIFSCGVSDTIIYKLNYFLFNHIPFWSGFRDSEKWSALLILSYAYFSAAGLNLFLSLADNRKVIKKSLSVYLVIPFLISYPMLFGFGGQLKAVNYPSEWKEVNEILNQDKDNFKVLFLPWHEYYSLSFNDKIITSCPAKIYFDKEIVQGENLEIREIFNQSSSQSYNELEQAVIGVTKPQKAIDVFIQNNIRYIIFTHDIIDEDPFIYAFLNTERVQKIVDKKGLTLYKIVLR